MNEGAPQPEERIIEGDVVASVENTGEDNTPIVETPVDSATEILDNSQADVEGEAVQTRREANKEKIREQTPEQRQENIETLVSMLPDFIAQSRSKVEAMESYERSLREEEATEDEIKVELARMEAIFEEMTRNSEDVFEKALERGEMTVEEVEERRAKIDKFLNMTPEEAAEEIRNDIEGQIDDKVNSGELSQEDAEDKKSELRKRLEGGLAATIEWASDGISSSSAETIFDLFLVFGVEGQFGTKGLRELAKGGKEGDKYLMEILGSGDINAIKEFIKTMHGDQRDIGKLTEESIKEHISLIDKSLAISVDWEPFNLRLRRFVNEQKSDSQDHDFTEENVKILFKTLNGSSADQIRKIFGIETWETSDEAKKTSGDKPNKTQLNQTQQSQQSGGLKQAA